LYEKRAKSRNNEKAKFTIFRRNLDEKWGELIGVIAEKKFSNSFTFNGIKITIMLLQLG